MLAMNISCSFTANWYYVGASTNGKQWYIDNASVAKNQQYAKIWVKIVNPDGTVNIEQILFSRNHYSSLQSYITYSTDGERIDSANSSTINWDPIPPESMADGIYNLIW